MATYERRDTDGTVVERISPEPGSLEAIRLAGAVGDQESPWSLHQEQQSGSGGRASRSRARSTEQTGSDTTTAS